MPAEYATLEETPGLVLKGELSIYTAAELKPVFFMLLQEAQEHLHLDLQGVDDIDGAGVQLLLLFRRELLQAGIELHIQASPIVAETLQLLHLQQHFTLAPASPSP